MMERMKRREFLKSSAAVTATAFAAPTAAMAGSLGALTQSAARPVVISSANGMQAAAKAMEMIRQGADALDAVIAGVNIVEDDPNDTTVGYGGLPNELGVVELDSCVMHGPTARGGGVASLRNIKNPSKVARVVMERTDHVLLVGEGALKFALAHGFQEENLLTEKARQIWLKWKEGLSNTDDWLPPHGKDAIDVGEGQAASFSRPTGTINCNGLDLNGNISGVTTTSGLAFKIPGRVGDSPILGAGLYVDNTVGAAGSTGRGEANLLSCSSVMVVEYMRQGKGPEEACLMACRRITEQTKMKRLLDNQGRPNFNVNFYAINKRGEYGAASIWSGSQFAVNIGDPASKKEDCAYLFKREKH